MSNKFWDEESVSEWDMMADQAEEAEEIASEIDESDDYEDEEEFDEDDDEEYDDDLEVDSAFELNTRETNVVHKARTRLEQARLYEMFLNHSLFEDVDSNPEVVKTVEAELKEFIVDRLEILLGIRAEKERKKPIRQVVVESPFNDIEADFLKQLAAKGTQGKSLHGATQNVHKGLKPIGEKKESSGGLKPLSSKSDKPKHDPRPTAKKPAPQKKKVPPKSVARKPVEEEPEPPKKRPVKSKAKTTKKTKTRKKTRKASEESSGVVNNKPEKNVQRKRDRNRNTTLTKEEIEAIAKSDYEETQRRKKPFHLLSAKEKTKRIKEVNERQAKKRSAKAQSFSQEQANAVFQARAQNQNFTPNSKGETNNLIANFLINKKNN